VKIAIFSLVIAISVAILSLFQFEKYQKFTLAAQLQMKKLDNEIKTDLQALHTSVSTLKEQEQAILNRTQHSAWKIAETQYLVNLAQTRLNNMHDVKTAIALLTLAEQKIQKLNDPALNALQESIIRDLAALKNIEPPNLEELWFQVSTIIEQSAKLPLRGIPLQAQASIKTFENPGNKSWKQTFSDSIKEITELVKIRHYSKPLDPVLTEAQQAIIKENLRLLLEQIRFSVLTTETAIYQQAIQDVEKWVREYYDDNSTEVKNVLNSLSTLKTTNLRPELPTITSIVQFNVLG